MSSMEKCCFFYVELHSYRGIHWVEFFLCVKPKKGNAENNCTKCHQGLRPQSVVKKMGKILILGWIIPLKLSEVDLQQRFCCVRSHFVIKETHFTQLSSAAHVAPWVKGPRSSKLFLAVFQTSQVHVRNHSRRMTQHEVLHSPQGTDYNYQWTHVHETKCLVPN